MYTELHIEYSDPKELLDSLVFKFKIRDSGIAQRWAEKVDICTKSYAIDDPNRFYGFDDYETEKKRAIAYINECCDIIDDYQPIVIRRISDPVDQDTLNYLHHIFEVYHGLLDQPHDFYIGAPEHVQKALAKLNIEVHRCESFVNGSGRRIMPRHVVTWFGMERNTELQPQDYDHFTDIYTPGTVYLQYVEIGKTLEDLAIDNDQYIHPEAYKPFKYYTADFLVRYFGTSSETWKQNRVRMKSYYEQHKDFFDSRGLPLSHPHNRPGYIPVADIYPKYLTLVHLLVNRQHVKSVKII